MSDFGYCAAAALFFLVAAGYIKMLEMFRNNSDE